MWPLIPPIMLYQIKTLFIMYRNNCYKTFERSRLTVYPHGLAVYDGRRVYDKWTYCRLILDYLASTGYTFDAALRPMPAFLINWRTIDRKVLQRALYHIVTQYDAGIIYPMDALIVQSYGFEVVDTRRVRHRVVAVTAYRDNQTYSCTIPLVNLTAYVESRLASGWQKIVVG